jgi:hypothetical protein
MRRCGVSPEAAIAVSERVVDLLSGLPTSKQRAAEISLEHQELARLSLECGDHARAVSALRSALEAEPDPEFRKGLEDIVRDFEE